MSQTFALLTASNFVGTPYQLQFCLKNLDDRLARLLNVQGVKPENVIVLREDYGNEDIRNALVALGKLAVKGDAILWFDASHGTDCDTPAGVVQSVCTKRFNFDDPTTWITGDWLEGVMNEANADVDWYLELDACEQGGTVREAWEKGVEGRGWTPVRRVRYMPHPDGTTPTRTARKMGLPVRDIVPHVRVACLTATGPPPETAIDADQDGFTGQLCAVLDGDSKFVWTPALLADSVGHRLDPSLNMHPMATGLIIDTPMQR